MKRFLFVVLLLASFVRSDNYGSYTCPEDGCYLNWERTEFCQGMNCRTVKIYKCPCCNKYWKVYQ